MARFGNRVARFVIWIAKFGNWNLTQDLETSEARFGNWLPGFGNWPPGFGNWTSRIWKLGILDLETVSLDLETGGLQDLETGRHALETEPPSFGNWASQDLETRNPGFGNWFPCIWKLEASDLRFMS